MHFKKSMYFLPLISLAYSCSPVTPSTSSLAVAEPSILSKNCNSESSASSLKSLSAMVVGQWTSITYDDSPCERRKRGSFGLDGSESGSGNSRGVTVIAYPVGRDPRIPENVKKMIELERKDGNEVIPVMNPMPGDVEKAIDKHASLNPNKGAAKEVKILIHGHGKAVYTDNQSPIEKMINPKVGDPYDTTVGDPYYPTNSVEVPIENNFSAKQVTHEALVAAKKNGIADKGTNCNLIIGTCNAGGAVQGMEQEWGAWESLGLTSAIGASAAHEETFDNHDLPQDLPSENLLGHYYAIKNNPDPALDLNTDGVIDLAEMSQKIPELYSVQNTGMVLGVATSPSLEAFSDQAIQVESNPVAVVPGALLPTTFSQQYEVLAQQISYAGNKNTPLFNVKDLKVAERKP